MYYIQIVITIALILELVFSVIYSFVLVINLIKRRSSKLETMKKTFINTFFGLISMFLAGLIWQDKADWDIRAGISFLVLSFLVSFIVAVFFALSFWSWKE
jgi:hypothetical protein